MTYDELIQSIAKAPLADRATYEKMALYTSAGASIKPEFQAKLQAAESYKDFFKAIYEDEELKETLLWAECAKMSRRNWLSYFEPKLFVQNLRLRTDGVPIQMGSGVVLAPTGSRDNIANLYVFEHGAFNRQAAEFVSSLGGQFTITDWDFLGVYGLYKYRGNVILEEWDIERDVIYKPQR